MTAALEFIWMRHGRSRADDEGVHEGRYDSPLTDVGRAQVQARAAGWAAQGLRPDLIIASPLQRAQQSAALVAQALGAPVELDPDWMEFNNGPLAGLARAEAEARFPEPVVRSPYEPFWGTGESDWEFAGRAARAVERLVRRRLPLTVVVAHGGSLNAALRHVTGAMPPRSGAQVWFAFGPAGYARLRYEWERCLWRVAELRSE